MKTTIMTLALSALAVHSVPATLLTYYVGVDGQATIPSGTYSGLANPNHNRLTFLYAHAYEATPESNHYHSKGRLVHTGPNLGASTAVINSTSDFVPEGSVRLTLNPGTGLYAGRYVSSPYANTSDPNYVFSKMEIGATDAINGFAPGTGENYMFNSSAGRWTGSLAGTHVHLQLVSLTPGLNVGSGAATNIGLDNPGDDTHLWHASDDLTTTTFTPVFWVADNAPLGNYTARFKLVDDEGLYGDSGEFEYRFAHTVPEPGSMALVMLGAGFFALLRRRTALK